MRKGACAVQPIVDHDNEYEVAAGLYAIGLLDGDDLASFAHHLAGCPHCQQRVALNAHTVASLGTASISMDPTPDLRARILDRAALDLVGSTERFAPSRTPRLI